MAFYRERGLKAFSHEVTTDGIGVGGGFIVGGAMGRLIENMLIKTPVGPDSPITQKLFAWAANNGTKAALYMLAKQYGEGTSVTRKATEALAGSVVYDSILRLANHGWNPADVNLAGYRIMSQGNNPNVQKLIQENSVLRTELNKALVKLAGGSAAASNVQVRQIANPDSSADFKYSAIPGPYERQTRFGAMPVGIDAMPVSPNVAERQRRYGAMPFEQDIAKTDRERRYGFASAKQETNVGAMFQMQ